jgi:hypothetical protein
MNFLIFLWNTFARLVSFFAFIVLEIVVFSIFVGAVAGAGMPGLAGILTVVFTIWIIVDIILRIFIGGSKNLIRYIFKF